MEYTRRLITCWKNSNDKATSYYNLASNDEGAIIKWLWQQGFQFEGASGQECHNIGDTDYFTGCTSATEVDSIVAFVDKIYGEWTIQATYRGANITISKVYPNVMHFLSFRYPGEQEEAMLNLFDRFEQEFCCSEIKEWKELR